jgi:hypothetical protein
MYGKDDFSNDDFTQEEKEEEKEGRRKSQTIESEWPTTGLVESKFVLLAIGATVGSRNQDGSLAEESTTILIGQNEELSQTIGRDDNGRGLTIL